MKKVFLFITSSLLVSVLAVSQEKIDSAKFIELDEVVISSTRVNEKVSVAHSNLNEEEIKRNNAAKNIPFLLQMLPSVVAYSEDGTGIGNTQYRIRGTDASRINVTLNGMPMNNPESQDVFWVNIPDLSNSLKSIQVQRGVGTANNGAASFGASISLQSKGAQAKAYGEASSSLGSYNSFLATIAAGSGVLQNGLSIDGRFSRIIADGYIRNAKVNHANGNISLSHYTDKQVLRILYINAIQHTGITWEGASPDKLEKDRRYNPAGEYKDEAGNVQYYDNETDNYYSHILQAIYSRSLSKELNLNLNFSYNNGYGYYENYKTDQKFSKFGLANQYINNVEYKASDIIRRKLMSNNLYTGILSLIYKKNKVSLTVGTMYSYYSGSHYGRLLWAKYNENIEQKHEWYRNTAHKRDINGFAKAEYHISERLVASAELQYRYIDYSMRGVDDDRVDIGHNNYYSFLNPKLGLSFSLSDKNRLFFSYGISNREPLRADIKDYYKSARRVKYERLYDYELGYNYTDKQFAFSSNIYYMNYDNQLVATGRLSDTGYKLQENVKDSYRMGIEFSTSYTPVHWLRLDANASFSRNKIKNYSIYYTSYDNQEEWNPLEEQISEYIGDTDIAFSPAMVASGTITLMPVKNLNFSIANKYVGKNYYDNSAKKENQLAAYYLANFSAAYLFDTKTFGKINLELFVNNIFNKNYIANAWTETYKFADGSEISYKGLFAQAPINFMMRLGISF